MDKDSLGDRMKSYEALSTSRQLIPNCPVYARIDGRAFHTLTRGLCKPYSQTFVTIMREVTKDLVEEFKPLIGYCQSDEISLGWYDYTKAPFNGRIQKLESVLASAAAASFSNVTYTCAGNKISIDDKDMETLRYRLLDGLVSFDCRCFNLPNETELANCFLWRENDAVKNSISSMARNYFSDRELQGMTSAERIAGMRSQGYDFFKETPMPFLRGSFFARKYVEQPLEEEVIAQIPPDKLPPKNANGEHTVFRSVIKEVSIPYRLTAIDNKIGVLFRGEDAELKEEGVTGWV